MGGREEHLLPENRCHILMELIREFSPDGKFYGVKVLKGIEGSGKHGLPESSHSSMAYLKMNPE